MLICYWSTSENTFDLHANRDDNIVCVAVPRQCLSQVEEHIGHPSKHIAEPFRNDGLRYGYLNLVRGPDLPIP